MAGNKLIFQSADKAKEKLTKERLREISKLYEKWADEIEKKADYYKTKTAPSYEVKVSQANRLKKMLKSSADNVSKEVEGIIKSSIYTICDDVIKANVDWVSETFGFDKKMLNVAYDYIPDDIVKKLVTGQIYEPGWSLSKSIWGDNQDTLSKTYKVVAGGLAQNKPIYEIAKDLEQYVRPSAKKLWNLKDKDGRRIYPKQVDYNAQRLARTLVQHGYQQSFVETTQDNPFITDYIWRSNGSRRCDICAARDGKHYKKNELPLDHPNGMCIIEPNVSNTMDDDIINWYKSPDGTYPEIDKFAKELGYEPKEQEAKSAKSEHIIVNGKNIVNTWKRREDQFDFEIEDIVNAQGFDGVPRLVDEDEFDKLVKESDFIAQRTYSADTQEILDSYRDMLYNGKWYIDCGTGGAQYGQGMYCAADWGGNLSDGILAEMKHYQELNTRRGNPLNYTETLTIDKSAKIIKYDDLVEMASNEGISVYDEKSARSVAKTFYRTLYNKSWNSLSDKEQLEFLEETKKNADFSDYGSYAVAKGYDVINAEGHGESGSYTVILNRTKLIIKRP